MFGNRTSLLKDSKGVGFGRMGLANAVGYEIKPVNGAQRLMQKAAITRPGAWAFSKVLHHLDRRLFKLTNGRLTVPAVVAGLPVLMVTTIGAKSGEARTSPLLAIPVGGDLAIIGTGWGQAKTPGWVYNLEADPNGQASYRDRIVDFVARQADADETDAALTAAAKVYPGYDKYSERVTWREIKVFVLQTPVESTE